MSRGRLLFVVIAGFTFEFFQLFQHDFSQYPSITFTSSSETPSMRGAGGEPSETVIIRNGQQLEQHMNLPKTREEEAPQLPPTTMTTTTSTTTLIEQGQKMPPQNDNRIRDMSQELAAMIALRAGGRGGKVQSAPTPPRAAASDPPPPPPPQIPQFDGAQFDYRQPTVANEFTLPQPKVTQNTTVVLVLSARQHFEERDAIRGSWAKDTNNSVYFVIGGPEPGNVHDTDRQNPNSVTSRLFQEQEQYRDIIDSIHPDSYKSLPYKLHFGVRWVYNNVKNVEWIVKADDDQVVRPKRLQFFVLRTLNPDVPMVLGSIVVGGKPHTKGKWAEDPRYQKPEYPPWAFGSAGYVMSRPIMKYLAETDDLYYYQGEDAGLGIWLDESPLQVTFLDTPELRKDEGCDDKFYVIGHDYTPQTIRQCFSKLGDDIPVRKRIVSFTAGRKDQHPSNIRNTN